MRVLECPICDARCRIEVDFVTEAESHLRHAPGTVCGSPTCKFTTYEHCVVVYGKSCCPTCLHMVGTQEDDFKGAVERFSETMIRRFLQHLWRSDKSGWQEDAPEDIFQTLERSVAFSREAFKRGDRKAALDNMPSIANLALMVWRDRGDLI